MKFKIVFLSILFLSLNSYSQKCKPFGAKKNKKTGVRNEYYGGSIPKGTNYFKLENKQFEWSGSLTLVNDGEQKINYIQVVTRLTFYLKKDGEEGWFETGTTFELNLLDGTSIIFTTTKAEIRDNGVGAKGFQIAPVSDSQLETLTNVGIRDIKISPLSDPDKYRLTFKLGKKKSERWVNQFLCFKNRDYDNSGKVQNTRKGIVFMNLADKYLNTGKFEKAKEFYIKALNEAKDPLVSAKNNILSVFLNQDAESNFGKLPNNLDSIRKKNGRSDFLKELEEMTLFLIGENPDITELEEILLLIAE